MVAASDTQQKGTDMTTNAPLDPQHPHPPTAPPPAGVTHGATSDKSFLTTWLLSWLLGGFGADRFYLGKIGTGIAKLLTFGGLGVWWLIDLIMVLAGAARDRLGRPLAGFREQRKIAWIVTGAVVAVGLIVNVATGMGSAGPASNSTPDTKPGIDSSAAPAPIADPSDNVAQPEASASETNAASAWADKTFGTFAPQSHSGTGDDVITLPSGVKAAMVTATHNGSANFAVSPIDASNASTGELLVNTIGSYSGVTAYGMSALGDAVSLRIMADGDWTIDIAPIAAAPVMPADVASSGDAVYLYSGPAGKITATHDGAANFIVMEETGSAFAFGLLVNEIGAYSGTVPLSSGPSLVIVKADGSWTLATE